MADPTAVQMEGFGILFIPLSANFFVDICLCYHKSNDTHYAGVDPGFLPGEGAKGMMTLGMSDF